MRTHRSFRPGRAPIALALVLGLAACAWWFVRASGVHAEDAHAPAQDAHAGHAQAHDHAAHATMDEAAMERWVRDWYATHPVRTSAIAAAGDPADTFFATGLQFNADGNLGTQIDNVQIFAGQSVLWQWVNGIHTTTNGTGAGDPNAGLLWDAPLMSSSPQFVFNFDAAGTFPFFCAPHEGVNMKGNVTVSLPADTFLVSGTAFDTDGSTGTQVDTAFVAAGQAVMWRLIGGVHTVTNGTDSEDPEAGIVFDVPIVASEPVFTHKFGTPGTFPFFCRPHENLNMRGVVVVTAPVAVEPVAPRGRGFTTGPWPNPTRGSAVSFRFALQEAGPVRAEVFDVDGRRVATVARGSWPAGTYTASWNTRAANGALAPAGVYYVRLEVPGFSGARRVVVTP